MKHWREMMDSEWLRWTDIDGHEPVVKISRVVQGKVGFPATKKPVIYFEGKEKPFAANVSCCTVIGSLHGNSPDGWSGKSIKLFVTTTQSKSGETVNCIRVRPVVPK